MKQLLPLLVVVAIATSARAAELKTVDDFRDAAAKAKALLKLPELEQTPEAIEKAANDAIAVADAALDEIAALDPAKVTFANTILALDTTGYRAQQVGARLYLIKETSTNPALRAAAEQAVKRMQEWGVGTDYREDVYRVVKAFEKTKPKLTGENRKLYEEVLRDYRRAGLDLPPEKREEVEQLRKQLAKLSTDFATNINQAQGAVILTKAELEGVPDSFLESPGVKTGDDAYTVLTNVTFHYNTVMDTARREDVRKRLYVTRDSLAKEQNVPLLNEILALRNRVALLLGYKSWADYQTEVKMAKNGATASKFIDDLVAGVQPKFEAERAELQKLKTAETGDPNATINMWDWRYYTDQVKKQRYTVDTEALRVFFPYQQTLEGMFRIYQDIFGLRFDEVAPPEKWIDDLQLYMVTDSATGEPLGLFYLDMFPREGKFNHFAQFPIIAGKRLPDGNYQRPTVALVCNFPPPSEGKPSLLTHTDVETLFHEFGHVMHSILTRANHARHSGTSVPGDFVEAPSQMLQAWVWQKKVLDTFAADYRDPANKIPAETIDKMAEARLATEGMRYRRQFSFASLDLALHGPHPEGEPYDAVKVSNAILERVMLPIEPETAFVAYFGHLMGYDAGYYGYAWADAIAADMATVFENAPDGYFDKKAGMRLRRDIYEPGDSRDVNVSIEKFLGRKRSIQPFLAQLGIGKEKKAKTSAGPAKEGR
jgi:thimet oligopeptidase